MSYILDALKKSEQKRRQGTVPDLLTVHDRPAAGPRKRASWHYILPGVLLLGAVIMTAWLYSSRPGMSYTARVQSSQPQSGQIASPVPAPEAARAPEQPVQTEAASDDKGQRETPPPVAARIPAREVKRNVIDNAAPGARKQPGEARATSKQALLREYELPPAIQQEIPKIAISAHFYDADPSASIVSVHGNVVHEGQDVAAGLKLEKITPEGVILNYKYYRFYRPVF